MVLHSAEPAPATLHRAQPVSSSPSRLGLSSLRGMDLKLGKDLGLALAVIAICSMPIVIIALLTSRAEDSEAAAGSIDMVNAFNDVVRTPDNVCLNPRAPKPFDPYAPPDAEEP